MSKFKAVLESIGKGMAGLWLSLLGILILFAFPLTGIALSFIVGVLAAKLVGSGAIAAITFFAVAFAIGLFLSVYVYVPHVKSVVYDLANIITDRRPE